VGGVALEVSLVCEPCDELEKLRAGLKNEMVGRRGMLCRVLRGGTVEQGERIVSLETPPKLVIPNAVRGVKNPT
jgi:MOSC domain-containing protein YiiM